MSGLVLYSEELQVFVKPPTHNQGKQELNIYTGPSLASSWGWTSTSSISLITFLITNKSNLNLASLSLCTSISFLFVHTHLSGDDGDFWDGGLCKCIQQFGSMSDDAPVLLSGTCGQPSQHLEIMGVMCNDRCDSSYMLMQENKCTLIQFLACVYRSLCAQVSQWKVTTVVYIYYNCELFISFPWAGSSIFQLFGHVDCSSCKQDSKGRQKHSANCIIHGRR